MPLYEFICECGHTGSFIKPMGDNDQDCPHCDRPMRRILSPCHINMGACGAYGYYDENLGIYCNTNAERKAEMDRQGVTEKGATPKNGSAWV